MAFTHNLTDTSLIAKARSVDAKVTAILNDPRLAQKAKALEDFLDKAFPNGRSSVQTSARTAGVMWGHDRITFRGK